MRRKRKIIYIAHPIAGDIQGNIKRVLEICRQVHTKAIIPVAPYILSLQYLNDEVKRDRRLGVDAGLEYFYRRYIEELWLFGDKISQGMIREITCALKVRGIPIFAKTKGTQEVYHRILKQIQLAEDRKSLKRMRCGPGYPD